MGDEVHQAVTGERLRFGIIGCGRIAPFHLEALQRIPDAQVVAVADVRRERARALAAQADAAGGEAVMGGLSHEPGHPVKVYTDYQKLLADPEVDAVCICTPSGLHPEMGVAAAQAGKHIVVEKPMSLTLAGADQLIAAASAYHVKLAVSFQNRFNPTIVRLRQALVAGRFGRLSHGVAAIRWRRTPEYYASDAWRGTWALDGGALFNQSIHDIDLLRWMMGPASRVQAVIARRYRPLEAEDVAVAALQFQSGALGGIEAATTVEPQDLEETLSIFGDRGTVIVGGLALNQIRAWRFADAAPGEEQQVQQETAQAIRSVYGLGHLPLLADFCQAIREDRSPAVDGVQGRHAIELVLAVYRAAETGQAVEMPLQEEVETIVAAQKRAGIYPFSPKTSSIARP